MSLPSVPIAFGASGPSMFMMSSSPFWNASQRVWSSSMMLISTRPTCGIFLPFICATSLSSPGCAGLKSQTKPR